MIKNNLKIYYKNYITTKTLKTLYSTGPSSIKKQFYYFHFLFIHSQQFVSKPPDPCEMNKVHKTLSNKKYLLN